MFFFAPAPMSGGKNTVTSTYCGSTLTTSTSDPLTLTSQAIGTASADRYIAVVIMRRDNLPSVSVTVAGVNCSLIIADASSRASIYLSDAPVPTGTTASIVIDQSGTISTMRVTCYALTGLNALSPYATDFGNSVSGSGYSVGFAAPAGSAVIVASGLSSSTYTPDFTATGITLTNDQNGNSNGLGTRTQHANVGTNIASASVDVSSTNGNPGGVVAVFY